MQITWIKTDGEHVECERPYLDASFVRPVEECRCPLCSVKALEIATFDSEDIEDGVAGTAGCTRCRKPIGRLEVRFSTIFGEEEDNRVLNSGRYRVY